MNLNPYESPRLPAESDLPASDECRVAWPATGAYRYYGTLVWHPRSPLPAVCVRTGQPADDVINFVLAPILDDDGTLPPRLEHRGRRHYDVPLPVNLQASKFRSTRRLAVLMLLGGILLALGSTTPLVLWGVPSNQFVQLLWPVVALLCAGLIAGGLRLLSGPPPVFLVMVDRTYLQLGGLHPAFLAALPPWPVPDRDSQNR